MKYKTGTVLFIAIILSAVFIFRKSFLSIEEPATTEVIEQIDNAIKTKKDKEVYLSYKTKEEVRMPNGSDEESKNQGQKEEISKQMDSTKQHEKNEIIQETEKDLEMFEIITDSQLVQYLSKFSMDTSKIKDYKKNLKQLSTKDAEYIQGFIGKFQGKMATNGGYFSIEPAVFDAEVEISGEKVNGQFIGDIEVKLINKAGKTISHSQYHGAITSFFTDEKIDNPNLISEDGDKNPSFYQLFLSRSLTQMVGSYYAAPLEGTNEYRRIGTLRLNKI